MKKRIKMKTLIAIILFAVTAFAQQKTPPPPGAARPLNLPKITEKKLANGLTVVLAPLPNVPKISSILTFRSATTSTDRTAHPGIAQIAAAVANEGTDTRTSKQIKEELRSIGGTLSLGSDSDSSTITASSLAEFSTRLFDLMSDVAQHPSFPETEVKLAQ
jgi:zinc protease